MRFNNIQYLEKEQVTVSCRNNNASAVIYDGMPVFVDSADIATNLGTDVHDAKTAVSAGGGISLSGTFLGIAKWNKSAGITSQLAGAQPGDVFEAVVYGFTDAIVQRRTRTATNATWPSLSAIGAGDQMDFETVNGYLSWVASQAASVWPGFVQAGSNVASTGATEASSLYAAGTVDTIRMKVFVRAL
jgi:hypothetical protein